MTHSHFNQENFNQQLIIAACVKLIEEDGLSAREVLTLLDEMKNKLWGALQQIEAENASEKGEN